MNFTLRHLLFVFLILLLGWSAWDTGGRYLHIQAISQVICGGGLILVSLFLIRTRTRWVYPLQGVSVLWLVALLLAWLFSVNRLASLEEFLRYLMYLSIPVLVLYAIRSSHQISFVLIALFSIAFGICVWGGLLGQGWGSTFLRTNDLAGYLLLLIPLAVHCLLEARRWGLRLLCFGVTLVFLFSLLMTQSRSSWVACVFSLLLLMAWHRQKLKLPHYRWSLLAGCILLAGAVLLKWPELADRIQSLRTLAIFQENGTRWRMALLEGAWRIFLDFPIIGSGPNTFASVYRAYQSGPGYYSINPHNYYLQQLAETGVMGTCALLVYLGALWRTLLRRGNELTPGILASLSASLFHAGFDIDWSVSAIPITFFFLAGLGLVRTDTEEAHKPAERRLDLLQGVLLFAGINLILLPVMNLASAQAYARALEAWQKQDGQTSRKYLQQARQWAPWPSGRHYALWAQQELADKNYLAGLKVAMRSMELDRYNTEYLKTAADLLLALNKPQQAQALLEKRVALTPYQFPADYTELGMFYWRQKKLVQAQTIFSRGIQAFPVNVLPRYERYTPSHRYQLFMLYHYAAELAEQSGQLSQALALSRQAQQVLQGEGRDLFVVSGLSSPFQALIHYWKHVRHPARHQSLHPNSQVPDPPPDFEVDIRHVRFLSVERSIFSSEWIYAVPFRKKGEQRWREIVLKDTLQGFPDGWKIMLRQPATVPHLP